MPKKVSEKKRYFEEVWSRHHTHTQKKKNTKTKVVDDK